MQGTPEACPPRPSPSRAIYSGLCFCVAFCLFYFSRPYCFRSRCCVFTCFPRAGEPRRLLSALLPVHMLLVQTHWSAVHVPSGVHHRSSGWEAVPPALPEFRFSQAVPLHVQLGCELLC